MSLTTDYVWAAGVWNSGAWADCVWMEASCTITAPTTPGGGSSDPGRGWQGYLDQEKKKHPRRTVKTAEEIYRETVMRNLKLEPDQAQALEVPEQLPDLTELETPLDQELAAMIHHAASVQKELAHERLAAKVREQIDQAKLEAQQVEVQRINDRIEYLRLLLLMLLYFYL